MNVRVKNTKIQAVIVCLIIILSLAAGCTLQPKPVETPSATPEPTPEPTPSPEPTPTPIIDKDEDGAYLIGAQAQSGDMIVQVQGMETSAGDEENVPQEGMEYVIVRLAMKNAGSKVLNYFGHEFEMTNSTGQKTAPLKAAVNSQTKLGSGQLMPGGIVEATVAFEQPVGDKGLHLTYLPMFWSGDLSFNVQETMTEYDTMQSEAVIEFETVYAVGEAGKLGDAQVTVTGVQESPKSDCGTPQEGFEFVTVTVQIENTGSNALRYDTLDFKMVNSLGQISPAELCPSKSALGMGSIKPGKSKEGTLVFQQPVGDQKLRLIYKNSTTSAEESLVFAIE